MPTCSNRCKCRVCLLSLPHAVSVTRCHCTVALWTHYLASWLLTTSLPTNGRPLCSAISRPSPPLCSDQKPSPEILITTDQRGCLTCFCT